MSAVRQQEAVLHYIIAPFCLQHTQQLNVPGCTQYMWQAACGESGAQGVCMFILIHPPPLQADTYIATLNQTQYSNGSVHNCVYMQTLAI